VSHINTGPIPHRLTDKQLTNLAMEHSSYTYQASLDAAPLQCCRTCGHYPRRPVIHTPYPCPVAQALGHLYVVQGMAEQEPPWERTDS
jgi:hypothetical protein